MRPGRLALGVGGALVGSAVAGFLALRPDRESSAPLLGPGAPPTLASHRGRTTRVRSVDGTGIHVETFGPADAPQVVLSHGWVNSGRVWQEVVDQVGDRLRLVTWDQPGHGASDPPPERAYTLDVHGDALHAVLQHATGPGPIVLAGHSLGGMTVLNVARRFPALVDERVVGLLLLSTMSRVPVALSSMAGVGGLVERLAVASRWALDRGGRSVARAAAGRAAALTRALTHRVALGDDASPAHVEAATRLFLETDPDVLAGLSVPILSLDEEAALAGIAVPTVVLTGEDDLLTPPAYGWHLAQHVPGAELVLLPGVGHMTPLEAAPVVAERLLRLAGVTTG